MFAFDEAELEGARLLMAAAGGTGERIAGRLARVVREVDCLSCDMAGEKMACAIAASDMLFIVSGMEDDSVARQAADLARLAREADVPTVALVTSTTARVGLLEPLRHLVDAFMAVSLDCLILADGSHPERHSASMVEEYLVRLALGSLVSLITQQSLICVDFADVKAIVCEGGSDACLGIGLDNGEEGAREAAAKALRSLRKQGVALSQSAAALAIVTASTNITMDDFDAASRVLHEEVHEDANLIVGLVLDDALGGNFRVLLLAKRDAVRPFGGKCLIPHPEEFFRDESL